MADTAQFPPPASIATAAAGTADRPAERPVSGASQRPVSVCIIGAGTSGVIAAKVLQQHGITYDCFEKGSGIGGIWRFRNDNGLSACYRSLHINTSKRMMVLSDFPFKPRVAEYPSHQDILEYFEAYVDHFGVRPHLTFNTTVTHVERLADGRFQVDFTGPEGAQRRRYDSVIVANGHHWEPRRATFPGHFEGIDFHAHEYVDLDEPYPLRDKVVIVVGSGNSAMDIACELSRPGAAGQVYLAQRSGVWIVPKVVGNLSQDRFVRHPMVKPSVWESFYRRCVPRPLRLYLSNLLMETLCRWVVGHPRRFGLKSPQHRFWGHHPTISQEVVTRLIHGDLIPKGTIQRLQGRDVMFEDRTTVEADAIIYCTGYRIRFPFFDPAFVSAPANDLALFQRLIHPDYPNLLFLGLVQPLCALQPLVELQAHFLASYLKGEYVLPPPPAVGRATRAYHDQMKRQFSRSESHTIQVDCPEYTYDLRQEWRRGLKRAGKKAYPLPVDTLAKPALAPSDSPS